ncbi:MAG TPA: carboxypeptidase regulatory-like domain-containing protein [Gemmatimonadaceae bacterium]|nr:carboxypeptidase regulatory-like domain-containing protein [Gemmatimonadaceae bacterium]
MRRIWLFVFVVCCAAGTPAAAQQMDVIRGRVTGPDSVPLARATVKAVSYYGAIAKTTQTDRNGRFTITYPNGEGDYWIEVTLIGYVPRRFEIKRIAEEEILIADARLALNAPTLDPVNVTARGARALPTRTGTTADVSGSERPLTNAGLPPDLAGNLAAMAGTIPGIQVIPGLDGAPDMFSALGMSPDQNSTTFEGLGSAVSDLPRDAQVSASIRPVSYDVANGGFSGAQISISTRPGNNFSSRLTSGVARPPDLEWTSDVAEQQGAKNTYLSLGGNASGPISLNQHFYNFSYQYGRTYSDLQTLLNTSAAGLEAAGVARDSASRLLNILQAQNIPATISNAPRLQARDDYSLQGNFDLTPASAGASGSSFNLSVLGNYSRNEPVGGGLILTTPGRNAQTERWAGNVSLRHTKYFWFGVLSRSTLGFASSGTENEPYLRLPSGSVRVNSTLEDGSSSIRSLTFGGNPSGTQSSSTSGIEFLNQMTWYSANNRHVLKLSTSIRDESYSNDQRSNLLGSFSFNSLADLEAGTPTSFSRTLYAPIKTGRQLISSVSLGDFWRPGAGNVQVNYGVRLDGNRFLSRPEFNQDVEDAFGLRNDNIPNRVYVSPRAGFQWIYGTAPMIAFLPGAARPPRALISGGVGMFQGLRDAQLVRSALDATGLPSSTQQISCVGAAAPIPDWTSYAGNPSAIPTECADGSAGTVFSNAAPSVSMFDAPYVQPRSLRSNLNWSGPILGNRFAFGVSATHSLNYALPENVDLNFNAVERFALDNEANRPVFANPGAIVPTTGAVALRDTRVDTSFRSVMLQKSDLRSETRQLYFSLKPVTSGTTFNWDAGYTLQDVRELYRGFSSTVGNPLDRAWDRSLGARHTFNMTVFYNVFDVVRLTYTGVVRSGTRYSPMVAGDINGDGMQNDRAFVYDPATASDPALASAMSALLDNGSAAARCLARQLGQLSSRGSCSGPWTVGGGLGIAFNPQKIGLPQRLSLSINLNNVPMLADLMMHGSRGLRGWGQGIQPDQNLLFVRGFDPGTQRYTYEVNQRFGSTRPNQSTSRALTYLSFQVRYDIGAPRERQVLTQRMDIGRSRPGTKLTALNLRVLGSSTIPNPIVMILQQADSLKLTRVQADSLANMGRIYSIRADSLWSIAARYLDTLPDDYDHDDAYAVYRTAREKTVDHLIVIAPTVKKLLTPAQRRRLPPQILNYLDDRVLKAMRSASSGDAMSGIFIR